MKYRSIFVSDTHLGSRAAQAKVLLDFLRNNSADKLYLVGDILDGWKVKQNKWKWKKSHSDVAQHVLKLTRSKTTEVIYVTGNHDEFLRPLVVHHFGIGALHLCNHCEHVGVDGKRYFVTHGDMFDGMNKVGKWVSLLGDAAYDAALWLNTHLNALRHRLGMNYWSLSSYLKHKVKDAVSFIFEFEATVADYCKRKGYDGIICGHIHHPEIKEIDGVIYMNDGDWVESCSALVEHHDGRFEIVFWKIKDLSDTLVVPATPESKVEDEALSLSH